MEITFYTTVLPAERPQSGWGGGGTMSLDRLSVCRAHAKDGRCWLPTTTQGRQMGFELTHNRTADGQARKINAPATGRRSYASRERLNAALFRCDAKNANFTPWWARGRLAATTSETFSLSAPPTAAPPQSRTARQFRNQSQIRSHRGSILRPAAPRGLTGGSGPRRLSLGVTRRGDAAMRSTKI